MDDYHQWLIELRARVQGAGRPAPLEAAPCDGCARAARCAAERLACTAFERFNAGLPWEISPRVGATHERYERLFPER